jgi:hypothetical protein
MTVPLLIKLRGSGPNPFPAQQPLPGEPLQLLPYTTVTGWLVADGAARWVDLPATWAGWTSWNTNPKSPIAYIRELDIGFKTKFIPLVTISVDGTPVIEEQHSDDGVTYSTWVAVGGQVDARFIRIRVTVTGPYPKIKSMRTILSASPQVEYIEDLNTAGLAGAYRIGVGDIRLPITKPFLSIKKVDPVLQSVGAGWSVELIDKSTSPGPRIKIYNAANTLADALIDATISGIAP